MLTLDILIAAYKPEGIRRVASTELPVIEGVRYIISWQCHEDTPVPPSLQRSDISIYRSSSIGLSNNRNEALSHSKSDIVLIADDDVEFDAKGIVELMHIYEQYPEIDLITYKSMRQDVGVYPAEATKLQRRLPRGYYVASIEISFRRKCNLLFCPELGLNSPRMHGGEDEIFLQAAMRKSLNCWFFPVTVCRHDHPSTGAKTVLSAANLRAAGCVIALTYGFSSILRVPLKARRVARNGQANFCKALWYIVQGALESHALLARNRDSLW